ncbi:site-specific DNA-methyltransferase [Hyphobacterium sp. SN044]|uniref:site-specific DNA-methyltransferase n=1 Tax=Hyphobacterium sp. SN044 TaxID=2912575 RepID=UPI001F39D83F|nr:DNA methyltransferase [Hyphobacterium sp. SN044]MCF8880524.1 site-specific DNA-methyltransferase [Hyphobacterium sp. SN044]
MTASIRDLCVETVPVSALKPYVNNPRTHSKRQIEQVAASIRTFGWTNPILVSDDLEIIAGHGRLEAARSLGLGEVPVMRLSGMSEAQRKAYVIADNRLAETAGWDEDLLRLEIGALIEMDLEFEIEAIGFETGEIDVLMAGEAHSADPESLPEPEDGPAVSELGDVWRLGRHRLVCGDALEAASYEKLMRGELADACFTDPPYNVPIAGHVSGLGKKTHDEFVMASGEMSDAEFGNFLSAMSAQISAYVKPGAIVFACMDWRHICDLVKAGEAEIGTLKNICVWNKDVGGMGSLYRSKHEMVAVFARRGARHTNNVQLGRFGRNRTNVWDYPGMSRQRKELAMHPTVKPTAMVADAIKDVTRVDGVVIDPFGGSGSTLLAAEGCGRSARLIELDARYCDLIIRRFEEAMGLSAIHEGSGETFSLVREMRRDWGLDAMGEPAEEAL